MIFNRHFPALTLLVALSALLLLPGYSTAKTWKCTNKDLEIQCTAEKCDSSDGFTPIQVSINSESGYMSICAYSGCFEGTGVTTKNQSHLLFSGLALSNAENSADVMVALDIEKKVAVLSGMSFAMPLHCE